MSLEIVEPGSLCTKNILKPARDVVFYIDTMSFTPTEKFKIYIQQEPEAINPLGDQIIANHARYDLILTFNEKVLKSCKNAILFQFYTQTWLDESDYLDIDTSKKEFRISCCVGSKRMTVGHHFRLSLYFAQELFAGDRFIFFRSSAVPILPVIYRGNPLLDSEYRGKFALFQQFQFSLVIENSRQMYYFTEKLIDCLITKTIPIYYGCTNIHEYFDTTGWILLETENVHEVVEKCSVLHENYYAKYKDTIEENYRRVFEYKDLWTKFNKMLRTIPQYMTPIA